MPQISQYHIIKNLEYLNEKYIPEQMIHRINHIKIVAEAISPLFSKEAYRNVLIHGPSGSGKTSSSLFLLQYLNHEEPNAKTAYIDCWRNWTRFEFLKQIANGLGIKILAGRVSCNEILFKIEKLSEGNPIVLVLDEVDLLQDKWILYSLRNVNLALIMITTEESFLFGLNQRIRSRLELSEKVFFPAYNAAELADILEIRANLALRSQSLNKEQIRRIAGVCGGNSHVALEALRIAATKAEREDCEKILDEHITFALKEARCVVRSKNLGRLNDDQMIIYQIVKKHKEIPAGKLRRIYMELASDPVSERSLRNYARKLAYYGLIRLVGKNRNRVYVIN